jgi:hypothetical protein
MGLANGLQPDEDRRAAHQDEKGFRNYNSNCELDCVSNSPITEDGGVVELSNTLIRLNNHKVNFRIAHTTYSGSLCFVCFFHYFSRYN